MWPFVRAAAFAVAAGSFSSVDAVALKTRQAPAGAPTGQAPAPAGAAPGQAPAGVAPAVPGEAPLGMASAAPVVAPVVSGVAHAVPGEAPEGVAPVAAPSVARLAPVAAGGQSPRVADGAYAPAPALAVAPAPAVALGLTTGTAASPELAHFLDGVPGVLRNSDDRVGLAVQTMLEVQGSLDDLREDLATEYKHWQAKKSELVAQRDGISTSIEAYQAALLEQKSARSTAERLRSELAVVVEDSGKFNASREDSRRKWNETQEGLNKDIEALEKDIEAARVARWEIINATHNRTDGILRFQEEVQNETLVISEAYKKTEEARAAQKVLMSRQQAALLKESAVTREHIDDLNKILQEQAQLLAQHRRLGQQAAEVAAKRHQLEFKRVNCTESIQSMNNEVAALVQSTTTDTVELQRCQAIDAENQKTQAKINECRAEKRSGR
mmetsp:Transcript_61586/g.156502  ORF Transcript_61586/g.156502 Transcript_61586/m.156502 type:complete len:441 (-) Transcript_61586:38-1360(-)|eukprot:CAMPEP_0183403950 /NCGR_PEP_ID=MMETSP0370-20130417/14893_1 /TAXON_ID=268820 /ORGANISM="Peridinium aciculiferum, Strain PAER-2" /LENGTH=440 /DNA_ID=CAMNT_0025585755 /DNA_START=75 /DNA_END=1397 /DNA_ORIENTATION=-